MLADNNTPLAAVAFEQLRPDGTRMVVVVARCRIELDDAGNARYAPSQELVLSDQFEGDPQRAPLIRPSDLVPYRPAADVTVRGTLRSDRPLPVISASIAVADQVRSVSATGPRRWFYDRTWRMTEPEAIAEVPLSYALAFGGRVIGHPDGAVDPRNPIGTGTIHPDFTPKSLDFAAPQIVAARDDPSGLPPRLSDPKGFGPIPPWWQDRQQHAGTYDEAWKQSQHPRLPLNFDYRFYQCAHPDLIMPGYLKPGMTVRTRGLRPGGAAFDFIVPDIAPFARYSFTDGREVEVRLHMDGLHLDLTGERPTSALTGRGWIEDCPALYRADLDMAPWYTLLERRLPVSGPEGLREVE